MAEENKRSSNERNNNFNLSTGHTSGIPAHRYSDSDMSSSEQEDSSRRRREVDRMATLHQENVVLKMEVETLKLRIKNLLEENKKLHQDSINIQVRAEQEEEYISNTLLKKIQCLKKEKETLATNYEQEEEYLTNDLTRQLAQLRKEKVQLEKSLEAEQENQVVKLSRRINKLERDISVKQDNLERLQREKIDLENALEHEQEFIVNKLWKKIKRIEQEKKSLTGKLKENSNEEKDSIENLNREELINNLTVRCRELKSEVTILKKKLVEAETRTVEQSRSYALEEERITDENIQLQRKLSMEQERRLALSRVLSESESSLDTDEDRSFSMNRSLTSDADKRERTISSPLPCGHPLTTNKLSEKLFSLPSPVNRGGGTSIASDANGSSEPSSSVFTKPSVKNIGNEAPNNLSESLMDCQDDSK
ncbi:Coiled-coil domain-containing protein 6 [Trichoplax sp. H2]|nr:Coiled-coil domain-containing protein 6 [Trichoplax sp. H2]|eukprot:RDD41435.1 Coiled-coil domain-containing protein 6 [Trichoplax sp. H2]